MIVLKSRFRKRKIDEERIFIHKLLFGLLSLLILGIRHTEARAGTSRYRRDVNSDLEQLVKLLQQQQQQHNHHPHHQQHIEAQQRAKHHQRGITSSINHNEVDAESSTVDYSDESIDSNKRISPIVSVVPNRISRESSVTQTPAISISSSSLRPRTGTSSGLQVAEISSRQQASVVPPQVDEQFDVVSNKTRSSSAWQQSAPNSSHKVQNQASAWQARQQSHPQQPQQNINNGTQLQKQSSSSLTQNTAQYYQRQSNQANQSSRGRSQQVASQVEYANKRNETAVLVDRPASIPTLNKQTAVSSSLPSPSLSSSSSSEVATFRSSLPASNSSQPVLLKQLLDKNLAQASNRRHWSDQRPAISSSGDQLGYNSAMHRAAGDSHATSINKLNARLNSDSSQDVNSDEELVTGACYSQGSLLLASAVSSILTLLLCIVGYFVIVKLRQRFKFGKYGANLWYVLLFVSTKRSKSLTVHILSLSLLVIFSTEKRVIR